MSFERARSQALFAQRERRAMRVRAQGVRPERRRHARAARAAGCGRISKLGTTRSTRARRTGGRARRARVSMTRDGDGSSSASMAHARDAIIGAGEREIETIVREMSILAIPVNDAIEDDDALRDLDDAQKRCVELALRGENVFVSGVGGTGKSKVLRAIRTSLKRAGKMTATTASTAIAAEAVNGTTLFAFCGLGLPKTVDGFGFASDLTKQRVRECDALLVDEVSMLSGELFDRLSYHLKRIRSDPRPCGGIQMILFGDFLQLGPVDNTDERMATGRGFCPALFLNRGWMFESWTWRESNIKTVYLETVYRQQGDMAFVNALKNIRTGEPGAVEEFQALYTQNEREVKVGASALRIVGTNDKAESVNKKALMTLQSKCYTFTAVDRVQVPDIDNEQERARRMSELHRLWGSLSAKKKCRIAQKLELKTGAKVMMLKNLDVCLVVDGIVTRKRLVNGARGFIARMESAVICLDEIRKMKANMEKACDIPSESLEHGIKALDDQVEWLEGQLKRDDKIAVPYVFFNNFHEKAIPILPYDFEFETAGLGSNIRKQIPLALAWGVTAHKSQGMSLDEAYVDCSNFFAAGQAYVALSRLRSLSGLKMTGFNQQAVRTSPVAKSFYDGTSQTTPDAPRGWWNYNSANYRNDQQGKILETLIRSRAPFPPEHTLEVHDLALKQNDRTWRCQSCGKGLRVCADMQDVIKSTIPRCSPSTTIAGVQEPRSGSARRASLRGDDVPLPSPTRARRLDFDESDTISQIPLAERARRLNS